jgi:hypothetical protein
MSWFLSFQKQEKYKDTEPTAIDLFKVTHCSKKTSFCEPMKNAIVSTSFLSFASCTWKQTWEHVRLSLNGCIARLLWKQFRLNHYKKDSSQSLIFKLLPKFCHSLVHSFKISVFNIALEQAQGMLLLHECKSYKLNLSLRSKKSRDFSYK